jgi:hypothetical protein
MSMVSCRISQGQTLTISGNAYLSKYNYYLQTLFVDVRKLFTV